MECYLAMRKKKILECMMTWIHLEGIILNEIIQADRKKKKKERYFIISLYVESRKTELSRNRKQNGY